MYGGGAGDEESFSFTLQLDADRGNYERRVRNNPNGNDFSVFDALVQIDGVNGGPSREQLEDLRPLMDQFHQLVLPQGVPSQPEGGYGVPARIFLDLGSIIQAEIGVDNVQEGMFHFGVSQLNVLKANLTIRAHVIEHSNVTNLMLIERNPPREDDPQLAAGARQSRVPSMRGRSV